MHTFHLFTCRCSYFLPNDIFISLLGLEYVGKETSELYAEYVYSTFILDYIDHDDAVVCCLVSSWFLKHNYMFYAYTQLFLYSTVAWDAFFGNPLLHPG